MDGAVNSFNPETWFARVTVPVIDAGLEHKLTLALPAPILWQLYRALQSLSGNKHAFYAFVYLTQEVASLIYDHPPGLVDPKTAQVRIWHQIAEWLDPYATPIAQGSTVVPKRITNEDDVLGFCYVLLRDKLISRDQAAGIATWLLETSHLIDTDAWRKKVDRYAERRRLRHPGQPRKQIA